MGGRVVGSDGSSNLGKQNSVDDTSGRYWLPNIEEDEKESRSRDDGNVGGVSINGAGGDGNDVSGI